MPHQDTSTMTINDGDPLTILLCAPKHDLLTEYTSSLLQNLPDLGAPATPIVFEHPLRYDEVLTGLEIDSHTTDVTVVFCGHGAPSALLGPPKLRDPARGRNSYSSFFDISLWEYRPKFMLAFCCSAAEVLGEAYRLKSNDSAFVGFTTKIGIITVNGIYADYFKKLLHELAAAMLRHSDKDALEASITTTYKEAIKFFHKNENSYRYARAMKWYLLAQLKAVKSVRT